VIPRPTDTRCAAPENGDSRTRRQKEVATGEASPQGSRGKKGSLLVGSPVRCGVSASAIPARPRHPVRVVRINMVRVLLSNQTRVKREEFHQKWKARQSDSDNKGATHLLV